ncbi:MAG TPA: LacI family DNA-binding transcriptional regulator [Verrucomicrobiota bacterium]|nr:LacI family DNA-binding transcriptional regulator [Verrucomicrobiota bacterium]
MVRLVDIARQAGVSVMTVSRVMRDTPDISAATRARVRALAEQMGYVPNAMAQSLRTRSTRLIAFVVPNVADPVATRILLALSERTHDLGRDLLVSQSLNRLDREEICIRRALARRIEGFFLQPVYRLDPSAPAYDEVRRHGAKVVVLGPKPPSCEPFVNVQADEALAASEATSHLIELGHRRIAFLSGPPTSPTAQNRFEGYRRALRKAGLEVDDGLIFHAGETMEDGMKAAAQMLGESAAATAVQGVNDQVAMGAATVFFDRGLRIPQDFSVVGCGNIPFSECFRVPLTTVRQPKYQLGLAAAGMMQALLRGESVSSRLLPGTLVVRASTGPPRDG